ncbi:MAG: NADP-dependent malic enzyme [Thaumarchaeota archaeon]|nr:NADP-dependent malic enzyme [Nitrososphaerota archaeon]
MADKQAKDAISLHKKLRGKITIESKISKLKPRDIQLIYTPGVAAVCKKIYQEPGQKYTLTSKANNVAIVTDGTRILGLGNIGPYAAMPVMEGKSVLYKKFGKVDAFPICLNTTKKQEIIDVIKAIEPVFGAINLEDIESPKVLEISDQLQEELPIPIFHDDRHGTAVVALAALLNSLKLVKKKIETVKIVIAGAGSAGYGICKLLSFAGCKNLLVVDSSGAIHQNRSENMNHYKNEIAGITNPRLEKGSLDLVLKDADVFIGVSGMSGILSKNMIQNMNKDSIIFALTNPEPEVDPKIAKNAGAKIIATGSYLYKNKVNNAIVFPYLMRIILDKKIKKITSDMLYLTAKAIADSVPKKDLAYDYIIPEITNQKLQKNITKALKKL